ncbi:MAG: double zinc ribbon domain-containing protein, partial [Candidatus Helarchaeota archaeon]
VYNCNITTLRGNANNTITVNNSRIKLIYLYDNSIAYFYNIMLLDTIHLLDNSNITVNNSYINDYNFMNNNYFINNSCIPPLAPTIIIESKQTVAPYNVIINWSDNYGINLTGKIKAYIIYKANFTKGNNTIPSNSNFRIIGIINYPDISNSTDLRFIDDKITDNNELWYKVGIVDEGGNYANSSAIHEQFVSGSSFSKLSANIIRDITLRTYDDITINISLVVNDINLDLMEDVNITKINITYYFKNGTIKNFIVKADKEIEGSLYTYTIPKNYELEYYTFNVLIYPDDIYDFDKFGYKSEYFTILSPQITFSKITRPTDYKIEEKNTITIQFYVLNDEKYIKNITIFYRYDEDSAWSSAIMQYNSTTHLYTYTFGPFVNTNIEHVYYYIVSTDQAGISITLLEVRSHLIYPAFPTLNLSDSDFIMIILISAVVGVVMGIAYTVSRRSASVKSKEFLNKLKKRIEDNIKKSRSTEISKLLDLKNEIIPAPPRIPSDILLEPGKESKELKYIYLVGIIGLIIGVSISLFLSSQFHLYELSTIILIVMLFLSLYIYIVWLYREITLNIRIEKFSFGRMIIGFISAILIIIICILMLQIGANISWVRYYIVDQSGVPPIEIFGIEIPSLYLKIISISFTSLILFLLSVYMGIRKNIKNIKVFKKGNASISNILYTKETFIKKTTRRTNLKIIIFLILLGIALIPYSESGFMNILPNASIILLPGFLVFVIFLLINMIRREKSAQPFLLEMIKKCPDCGTINLISALFCRNCKRDITTQKILFGKVIQCKICETLNPINSKFCMNCGSEIKIN